MSSRIKNVSKLATLDAAKVIYFIVIGLAIKESLSLMITECNKLWKWTVFSELPPPPWFLILIVAVGYLVTAIRFSHGISMLLGHEKSRLEAITLPSSRRISLVSLLILLLAIFLYLMAMTLFNFSLYVAAVIIMSVIDLILIGFSSVLRKPFWRSRETKFGWDETLDGYQSRAALQWILSDILLIAASFCFLVWHFSNKQENQFIGFFFGIILILLFLIDYIWNGAFYFGGKNDRRKHKFAFVCSPLNPRPRQNQKTFSENIKLAQFYCYELMIKKRKFFSKKITPFAAHCFYTYFLDDTPLDILIGRQCAIAYLNACDAICVYVPKPRIDIAKMRLADVSKTSYLILSDGMQNEIIEAQKLGLEILFHNREALRAVRSWSNMPEKINPFPDDLPNISEKSSDVQYEGGKIRKRVYVCTPLRGKHFGADGREINFNNLADARKREVLQENVKRTLWECRQLAKDTNLFIAPFAPHAFFTYFYRFPLTKEELGEHKKVEDTEEWKAWYENSIEVLKVCDAVYIYTDAGLPESKDLSEGMKEVLEVSENLGIEVIYKSYTAAHKDWNPYLPDFDYGKQLVLENLLGFAKQ